MKLHASLFILAISLSAQAEEPKYSLEIKANRPTIQVGENVQIEVFIHGTTVTELTGGNFPDAPRPLEWSPSVTLSGNIGYEPKSSGVKEIGPFTVLYQGQKLTSNRLLIEVTPPWPRSAEKYEFRVFPKTVQVGETIRVYFWQQYCSKPFFDPLQTTPFDSDPKQWKSWGDRGWTIDGKLFRKSEFTFDIPATTPGQMIISQKDLPSMPAGIEIPAMEITVVPKTEQPGSH